MISCPSEIAIVGNGPSAARRGAEIDACEFVVRCNNCNHMGAGAGVRIDALAWFGDRSGPCTLPLGVYEHWLTLPPSRLFPPHDEHKGTWQKIHEAASGVAPIRWITDWQWQLEVAALVRAPGAGFEGRQWIPPTTGLTAVHLALLGLRPRRLCLYGFDATVPAAQGYDAGTWSHHHDFAGEKAILAALRDHAMWLGQPLPHADCEVIWPDAPAVDQDLVRQAAASAP